MIHLHRRQSISHPLIGYPLPRSTVADSDLIVCLSKGEVAEVGSPEDWSAGKAAGVVNWIRTAVEHADWKRGAANVVCIQFLFNHNNNNNNNNSNHHDDDDQDHNSKKKTAAAAKTTAAAATTTTAAAINPIMIFFFEGYGRILIPGAEDEGRRGGQDVRRCRTAECARDQNWSLEIQFGDMGRKNDDKNIVIRFEVAQFDVDSFLKTCILNHLCNYRYPPGESMPGTRMRL